MYCQWELCTISYFFMEIQIGDWWCDVKNIVVIVRFPASCGIFSLFYKSGLGISKYCDSKFIFDVWLPLFWGLLVKSILVGLLLLLFFLETWFWYVPLCSTAYWKLGLTDSVLHGTRTPLNCCFIIFTFLFLSLFLVFFCFFFFFFQAEDGIRDDLVTGVQTCALPI